MKPLCADLFCGLGGWSDGFIAEGYDVIGFDIERHDYGTGGYPGQLVLQDALTLHGSQFKDVACIVASPPCQEYSYMAMPWKLAKAKAVAIRADESGAAMAKLTAMFDACFRIQREAIQATGKTCQSCHGEAVTRGGCRCEPCDGHGAIYRHVPLVVENVKGAQPWVGRAQANYGSFYLWGDVRSVGGRIIAAHRVEFGAPAVKAYRSAVKVPGMNWSGSDQPGYKAVAFNDEAVRQMQTGAKNEHCGGGSWFAIGSPGQTNTGQNPDVRKVPNMNFHEHEKTGKPGRSFQSAAVESSGVKQAGHSGRAWFADPDVAGHFSSKSPARKAASAQIAKIPFELAAHIARCFKPNKVKE